MKKQKGLKLRNKLILIYVPFLVLTVLFLGAFLTEQFRKNTIDQSIRVCQQSADLIQNNLLHQLDQFYLIAYDIASDSNLQEYLCQTEGSDYELYSFYSDRILGQISKAYYSNSHMQLHIYTSNMNLQYSGLFIRDKDEYEAKKALLVNSPASVFWEEAEASNQMSGGGFIGFLMPISRYDNYTGTVGLVGVLELRIRLDDLRQYLPDLKAEQNLVLLTDGEGRTVVSNSQDSAGLAALANSADDENAYVDYGGQKYLLLKNTLNNETFNLSGWTLTTLVPLDTVYRSIWNMQTMGAVACLLCLLIVVPLIVLFARNITKRLEYLVGKMNEISQGNDAVSVTAGGRDEITRLGEKFSEMLQTLDLLTKEEMQAKLKEEQLENARKEACIFALERQINPHYLFNTLESIRMSLVLKGDRETADLVLIFAKSYRKMIDDSRQAIALRDELAFVHDYFTIQDFRHAGKIRLKTDVPEELLRYCVPKFLIQPLIENAIVHGLELKESGGTINLTIRREDSFLTLRVSDDGIGMNEKELEALRTSLYSKESSQKSYALRNIAERLSLLYGTSALLTVESKRNVGTEILVKLPINRLEVK